MFDAVTATFFHDPNLSELVTYTSAAEVSFEVRAIRSTRSADFKFDGTAVRSDAVTFKIRVANVPNPAEGDTITDQAGATYVVQGAPTRAFRGLAWLIEAVPA